MLIIPAESETAEHLGMKRYTPSVLLGTAVESSIFALKNTKQSLRRRINETFKICFDGIMG